MRSRSLSSAESLPTTFTERMAPAVRMPMISITTRISISVNPPARVGLLFEVPVADIRIVLLAAGLAVGAERIQVEVAMRARTLVHVGAIPGILAHALHVAAILPVHQRRVGRTLDQRIQSLLGGGIAEVVQPVQ